MSALLLFPALVLAFIEPPTDYGSAIARVEAASKAANRSVDPDTIETLADALDASEAFPVELADDDAGREQRLLAQLNLARIHLHVGDDQAATLAMDRAIFWAGDEPLLVDRFGPEIGNLYQQRLADLQAIGRGTVEVNCGVSCVVYVDGNRLADTRVDVYVGVHQVHVTSGDDDPLTVQLLVGVEGCAIEYGREVAPTPEVIELPNIEPVADTPSRLVWGMRRPPATWKLASVGVSGALFVASTAFTAVYSYRVSQRGPLRRELFQAAEDSLDDGKPSNDINPNMEGDLCDAARTPPDPSKPHEVTNLPVREVCLRFDKASALTSAGIISMAITGGSTLLFGLLLGVHRESGRVGRVLNEHQFGLSISPRLEGGFMLVGGARF